MELIENLRHIPLIMNKGSLNISNSLWVDSSTQSLLCCDYLSIQNIIINIILLPHLP
ncbi:protein of unknown function [Legionella fallonii LLAP-10]|uniref:Uncharacterized protein n=1 Tax=Legionella fallonii LLAP-10 TaxID=1212491 RepID=A0A098GAG3_9GAMM|nr:protein of unknown function [Legionella fallonii LLAP-10]